MVSTVQSHMSVKYQYLYRLVFRSTSYYLIDQRRLLFWKKMLTSNNVLLRILARLCQLKTVALAAKCGIFQIGSCSVRDVKCGIFSAFRNTVL